jgi:hypothetical protein
LVCDGNGACVGCLTAADCPGTDSACQHKICTSGSCGTANTAVGTLVTNTPAGDCHKDVCDGNGAVVTVVDNTDLPSSANPCLGGACNNGTPSNPPQPSGTACSQGNGIKCDGAGACVACLAVSDCAGTDTTCQHRTCVNGSCGVSNSSFGTLVTLAPVGDCHRDVCDGSGGVTSVVDDSDLPANPNQCLQNVCAGGIPSNPPQGPGSPCNQGGLLCDGNGTCVGCLVPDTCPGGPDTTCQTKTCIGGTCGLAFAASGTLVTVEPAGDCQKVVCDSTGGTTSVADNTDLPTSTNQCLQNVCAAGVPSNPPQPPTTTCNQTGGSECDGAGACVQCLTAADCPGGPDTECNTRTCTNGVCGLTQPDLGTPLAPASQTAGDCQTVVCDGAGGITSLADDTDGPPNTNQCATTMCVGGVPDTTNSAHGTSCTQNNGRTCDGQGSCLLTFSVERVGDGAAALTSAATAVFVEEHKLDGTLVGTIALPTVVAATGNAALTSSGSASSEGGMSLSGDGRYLVLAGYNAAPTAAGVAGTTSAATNRIVGRIGANGVVDTTTRINSAYSANNVRGATSQDGTGFWLGGNGTGTTTNAGGTWFVSFGSTGAATQLAATPALTNTRWPQVQGGQLYASASSGATFNNVHTVGTGLPTTGAVTLTVIPGMPANLSPFGYVFFDRDGTAGFDTLYVADDGGATTRGIQKWTLGGGGTWSRVATFQVTTSIGFRGLAGAVTGSSVTLIGSTDEAVPRLFVFVDTGSGTPTGTLIGTSPTNTAYRGIALAPHL